MAKYFCAECGEPSRTTDFGMSACCHAEITITETNEPRLDFTQRSTASRARPIW